MLCAANGPLTAKRSNAVHRTWGFAPFHRYGRRNADGTKPICAQTRHCTFAGYIDENAIHEKFQGVPPLPAGSVCRFAAIVDELCPSGLAALFMYQHPAVQEYRKVGKVCVSHAIASGTPLTNTHTDRTQS